MIDYNFGPLNDKEFESLCVDLVGGDHGRRFERFKPGKDAGVDGRYFSDSGGEVILQVKHWIGSPLTKLIAALRKEESVKVRKLNPERYVLCVSHNLSRADKEKIKKIFDPFIRSASDIYGSEDINDLIKSNPEAEKNHYKLWLSSSRVLSLILNSSIQGRSSFELEEIREKSFLYVRTDGHEKARKILENKGVIIISGEPGIGKTTLASQLCIEYVAEGYEFFKIMDDLKEAESVFDSKKQQVFYFDDFLGANYLEALRGYEGAHISSFIRRVSKDNKKRFILTSRSTILNQGKFLISELGGKNIRSNELELNIKNLKRIDKARMLYNHMYNSLLTSDFLDEIYKEKKYREIVDHANYNPRLVSFILDQDRASEVSPKDYWSLIKRSLHNPSQIWDNPFQAQLDDYSRHLVLLVVMNGNNIGEQDLSKAFYRFTKEKGAHGHKGSIDFNLNMKHLVGSFLTRMIGLKPDQANIGIFNPSVADYVISRYKNDPVAVEISVFCLRTRLSLQRLQSMVDNGYISRAIYLSILKNLLSAVYGEGVDNFKNDFLARLCFLLIKSDLPLSDDCVCQISVCANYVSGNEDSGTFSDDIHLVLWAIDKDLIPAASAARFLDKNTMNVVFCDDIENALKLYDLLVAINGRPDDLEDSIIEMVTEYLISDIEYIIDEDDIFEDLGPDDSDEAEDKVFDELEYFIENLGVSFTIDIEQVVEAYDVDSRIEERFSSSGSTHKTISESVASEAPWDDVDDLFDR